MPTGMPIHETLNTRRSPTVKVWAGSSILISRARCLFEKFVFAKEFWQKKIIVKRPSVNGRAASLPMREKPPRPLRLLNIRNQSYNDGLGTRCNRHLFESQRPVR